MVRGGSWHGYRHECQSSGRNSNTPDRNVVDVGFRVVVGEPIKDKPPKPRIATPRPAGRARGRKVVLRAADAILHGRRIQKEKRDGKKMTIGRWLLPSDWVSWNVSFPRAGTYEVVARLAALKQAEFRVHVGPASLTARSCATADYDTFQTVSLGTIRLNIAGRKTVEIRAVPEGWQPMNIAFLEFRHKR